MNYLSEIVSFTEWKEVNQLPASAIALWYELMAICNKTGWQQEFTVPNGLLQIKAGLSRKEFERARQLLIQAGRIIYKKSNRANQAGKYILIPFVQKGQQQGQQEGQREEHSGGNERGTLYKLKLNDNNNINNTREGNLFQVFEQEFGRPLSPMEVEHIQTLEKKYTVSLVTEALRCAVIRGKHNMKYVDRVLIDWDKNNVRTHEEIQRHVNEFEKRKKGGADGGRAGQATGNARGHTPKSKYNRYDGTGVDWKSEPDSL